MLLDTPLTGDQRDLASTVRVSGTILLSTVSNFLDFFKVDAGRDLDVVQDEVDLPTTLSDVGCVVAAMLRPTAVSLCAGSPPRPPPVVVQPPLLEPDVPRVVLADGDRMRGVLLNLMTNAAKFTRAGAVAVRVSLSASPWHAPAPPPPSGWGGGGAPAGAAARAAPRARGAAEDPSPSPRPGAAAAVLATSSLYATSPPPLAPPPALAARSALFARAPTVAAAASPPRPSSPLAHRSLSGVEALPATVDGWAAVASRWTPPAAAPPTLPGARWLVFEVADTGVGVTPASLTTLFQDFAQGDAARAPRPRGGTGLGLAIVSRQVAALGGQVGAASKPGAGSVFWFSLPLALPSRGSRGDRDRGGESPPPLRRTASWGSKNAFSDGHMTARSGPGDAAVRRLAAVDRATTARPHAAAGPGSTSGGPRRSMSATDLDSAAWRARARASSLSSSRASADTVGGRRPRASAGDAASAGGGDSRRFSEPIRVGIVPVVGPRRGVDGRGVDGSATATPPRASPFAAAQPPATPPPPALRPRSPPAPSRAGAGRVRQSMEARRRRLDTAALHGRRVLLAEDNLINQTVATRMCASLGISVTVASNGEEAIAAVRGCGGSGRADTGGATSPTAPPFFDVILMDMSMPGVNGCDAARALRAQGCATPIVAMTANASDADRDACMAAGMDGFLSKPVLRDRLAEALLLVLTGRARFQDSDTFAAGFLAAPRA